MGVIVVELIQKYYRTEVCSILLAVAREILKNEYVKHMQTHLKTYFDPGQKSPLTQKFRARAPISTIFYPSPPL